MFLHSPLSRLPLQIRGTLTIISNDVDLFCICVTLLSILHFSHSPTAIFTAFSESIFQTVAQSITLFLKHFTKHYLKKLSSWFKWLNFKKFPWVILLISKHCSACLYDLVVIHRINLNLWSINGGKVCFIWAYERNLTWCNFTVLVYLSDIWEWKESHESFIKLSLQELLQIIHMSDALQKTFLVLFKICGRPYPRQQRKTKSPKCSDKLTNKKLFMTPNLVTDFENKMAHWPGRDQCYHEHQTILFCMLSIPCLEDIRTKWMQKPSFSEERKEKNNYLGFDA